MEAQKKRRDDWKRHEESQKEKMDKLKEKEKKLFIRRLELLQRKNTIYCEIMTLDNKVYESSKESADQVIRMNADQQAIRLSYKNNLSSTEDQINSTEDQRKEIGKSLDQENKTVFDLKEKMHSITSEIEDSVNEIKTIRDSLKQQIELTKSLDEDLAGVNYNFTLAEGAQKVEDYNSKINTRDK